MHAIFLRSGLILLLFAANLAGQTFRSGPAAAALIELYTSEGCSSCPPAERWLGELKDSPSLWTQVVPVAFHVNYWDSLGWPDAYAQADFTQRQRDYASWTSPVIYTPEFVYQGHEWHPGSPTPPRAPEAGVLILQRAPKGGGTVSYQPGGKTSAKTYEAWVAVLGGDVRVQIRAGENAGRTLSHDFIALHVARVPLSPDADGTFTGIFPAPPQNLPKAGRHALAAWISRPGNPAPLQAAGGWLP